MTGLTTPTGTAGPAGGRRGAVAPAGQPGTAGRGGAGGPGKARGPGRADGPAAAAWRRWRAPAVLVAIILVGGVVIAMLEAGPAVTRQLDPRNVGPGGTHALAALLAGQGKQVSTASTAAAALAQANRPHTALVIADPGLIPRSSWPALAAAPADLLIIAPGARVLGALAPGVTPTDEAVPVTARSPRCAWPGARLAGTADMGGLLLRLTARGAWHCYPAGRAPAAGIPGTSAGASLVRYRSGGRVFTVLGTGAPLTNRDLGSGGNAALALNLLGGDSRIVWLIPEPVPSAGPPSVTALIPGPVYLVLAELAVALVLAAAWRMRRFGPLVSEPLPVVVRASETVAGHGRLYRSRRARDRAAGALRGASLARIITRTGLPKTASPEVISQELARRTGRGDPQIRAILFGPAPGDDAALVRLANDLDTLEGQVLSH
jgi:Domain of unknown function (DUF4350)